MRTLLLTVAALACFAGNSLLARLALRGGELDGGSFTAVRIVSGALTLAALVAFRRGGLRAIANGGSARAAFALFAYAILFSLAYLTLSAGTGALILFAAVQITMLSAGVARGHRPGGAEWCGLALAFGGLVYLVSPGLSAPPVVGAALMAAAGAAWGFYTMAAKGAGSPLEATAGNFARATPMALAGCLAMWAGGGAHMSFAGAGLAVASGALTSGLGYAIWYTALETLPVSRAAIVQLTVPLIAAVAGVALLGEAMSWRLAVAAATILGGVGLALTGKARN